MAGTFSLSKEKTISQSRSVEWACVALFIALAVGLAAAFQPASPPDRAHAVDTSIPPVPSLDADAVPDYELTQPLQTDPLPQTTSDAPAKQDVAQNKAAPRNAAQPAVTTKPANNANASVLDPNSGSLTLEAQRKILNIITGE